MTQLTHKGAFDRTTASAGDADLVPPHEGNGYLTNKFGGVQLLEEGKRFPCLFLVRPCQYLHKENKNL